MLTDTHSLSNPHRISVGDHLHHWRKLRRLSQQDLALEAELSTRHLSCVETGKSNPSRELVLRLCERLSVPLRERNVWLVAAGYAPMYREQQLGAPDMHTVCKAVQHLLDQLTPWPAVAFDRHWNLVLANDMVQPLLDGVDPILLTPPINLLRVSLHPMGLATRIINLGQWRAHLFSRLQQQIQITRDPTLKALLSEIKGYPAPSVEQTLALEVDHPDVFIPFIIQTPFGILNLITTTTVFGSPTDITLQELALETLIPGDEVTAQSLRNLATTLPRTQSRLGRAGIA